MFINSFLGFAAFVVLVAGCSSLPSVSKRKHIHRIHGHERVDQYHWMKDPKRENKDVLDHLHLENKYTDEHLAPTSGLQENLYNEMIGRLKEDDASVPYLYKDYFYYQKTIKGKGYPIYCRKKAGFSSTEEILLDPNKLAEGKTNLSVGAVKVSPDQMTLAYAVDEKGEERYTILFKDLKSGIPYKESIVNSTSNIVWGGDSRTIFFTRVNKAFRPHQVLRFHIGGKEERLVYEDKNDLFEVWVGNTQDEKFLLMGSNSFSGDEVYYLKSAMPKGQWRIIQKREDKLEYRVEHHQGNFYVLNNSNGATNFKISRTPVAHPGKANWTEYIRHDEKALIGNMLVQKDRLIYKETRGGLQRIRYVNFSDGARFEINFDEQVYSASFGENRDFNSQSVRLRFQSPVTPPIVYDFNFASREFLTRKKQVVPGYDPSLYKVKFLIVKARDGKSIPVTLLSKKTVAQDGSAPGYIYGYGSYGYTITPDFRSTVFNLVNRGFVFAIAHVRGGQINGRNWYEDGKLMEKKNSFNDFVDVTLGLVGAKYMKKDKVAIEGRSAGGLLMGAVINQRPELYSAVVAGVPFVDVLSTILDSNLRFSTQEYQQWGDPNNKEVYNYILGYSPYDNISEKKYPALLAIAGLHDSRVNYWEPAKWVAKLREFSTSDRPILLRTQMEAGHGGSNSRYKKYREAAESQAFVLQSLGLVGK